jgi:hypothetical protein
MVQQAYTRYATRVVPERGTEGVEPPIPDIELEIGLVMRSDVIRSEDGDDGALHLQPAALDGRPGTRAPHVVLTDGRSTLDLFGSQFVVLRPAGIPSTTGRPAGRRRTSSTPSRSPRPTACRPAGRRSSAPTASSPGAHAARPTATNSRALSRPRSRSTRNLREQRP